MFKITMLKAGSEYSPKKDSVREKCFSIIRNAKGSVISYDDYSAKGGTAFDLRFFESKGYVSSKEVADASQPAPAKAAKPAPAKAANKAGK